MSSNDKQGDVATQRKEDSIIEKEKDVKSDPSPKKRSASELNNTEDEVKHKALKTDHKEENGDTEDKFDDDEDEDAVPDDYDEEAEDGEGEGDEDGAEDDDDEEDDA